MEAERLAAVPAGSSQVGGMIDRLADESHRGVRQQEHRARGMIAPETHLVPQAYTAVRLAFGLRGTPRGPACDPACSRQDDTGSSEPSLPKRLSSLEGYLLVSGPTSS